MNIVRTHVSLPFAQTARRVILSSLVVLFVLAPTNEVVADPLDPNAYPYGTVSGSPYSGTLTTSTAVTVNTSAGGGPTFTVGATTYVGALVPTANGGSVAVFVFDGLTVNSGITLSGTYPAAILSRNNLTINSTVSVNGGSGTNGATQATLGGPGIGGTAILGGFSGGSASTANNAGSGAPPNLVPGGFGSGPSAGVGGVATSSPYQIGNGYGGTFGGSAFGGGETYGNLFSSLVGGSGGGSGGSLAVYNVSAPPSSNQYATGGGGGAGGGAIELGANGTITLSSTLTADGGTGGAKATSSLSPLVIISGDGGGGAGGGILIHGSAVSFTSLTANGGTSPVAAARGGGGRIAIAGVASYQLGSALSNVSATGYSAGIASIVPNSLTVPTGWAITINQNPIASYSSTTANVEVFPYRSLTVNSGATATLGASNLMNHTNSSGNNVTALTVNGTFNTGSYSQAVASLTGSGTVNLGVGGSLTVGVNDTSSSYDGTLTGTGKFIKTGGGTLTVSNSVSPAGGIDVVGGTLQFTGTATLAGSTCVNIFPNAGMDVVTPGFSPVWTGTINVSGALQTRGLLSGSLTGAGEVLVSVGTVEVRNPLTFSGSFSITGGTLYLNKSAPDATVTVGAGGTWNVTAPVAVAGATVNGNLNLSAMLTIGGSVNAATINGTTSGVGGIIKTGPTDLTLAGTLNYTGATQVLGGKIILNSTLPSGSAVTVGAGATLTANASALRPISGSGSTSTITVGTTGLTLGDSTSSTGFNHQGTLDVGNKTVTLASKGLAQLGALTSLAGGQINAANGVSFGTGANFSGYGTVSAKIAAGFGSTIEANGGNLTLGNSSSTVGFTSDGELYTGGNTVTINDANQAVLGSFTQIGSGGNSGTLTATNGLVVDYGKNLAGQGTINSTNTLAKAVIINGDVQATGTGLTFTGYVKGSGTYSGPVTFNGTYAPGNSPASVGLGNDVTFGPSSVLSIEIGGLTPGSGPNNHDQVNIGGVANLNGTLDLALYNGFVSVAGDKFVALTFGSRTDTFTNVSGTTPAAGLLFTPVYSATNVAVMTSVATDKTWGIDGSGSLSTASNWLGGVAPTNAGVGDSLAFTTVISGNRTVTADAPITTGTVKFDGVNNYTVNGSGPITLQNVGVNPASIFVQNVHGNAAHSISAPVKLSSDLNITQDSSAMFTLSGPIDDTAGKSITKGGAGTLAVTSALNLGSGNFNLNSGTASLAALDGSGATSIAANAHLVADHVRQGSLTLAGTAVNNLGSVQIRQSGGNSVGTNAGASRVTTLAIASDPVGSPPTVPYPSAQRTYYGTIDLTNNDLVIDNATLADVTDMVRAGMGDTTNLTWTGKGITSSYAQTGNPLAGATGLGVVRNIADPRQATGTPLYSTFDGQTVAGDEILVKYTWFGDFDLDGTVTSLDFALLDAGFAGTTQHGLNQAGWFFGDANLDGMVNSFDFTLATTGYNSFVANGTLQLPEPSTLAITITGFVGVWLVSRRRPKTCTFLAEGLLHASRPSGPR